MPPLRPIAADSERLSRQILDKRARLLGQVLRHWRDIVGAELARKAVPERISRRGGKHGPTTVLELRVIGAYGHEIAHRSDEIRRRLNTHLGGTSIDRIKLHQGNSRLAGPTSRDGPAAGRASPVGGPLGLGPVSTQPAGAGPAAPAHGKRSPPRDGTPDPGDDSDLAAALDRLGAALGHRSKGPR